MGPPGARADENRARARRAAIYIKSVGIPDRWPRQNALVRFSLALMDEHERRRKRERESVVVSFTKKLARGEAASGDEHGISGTRRLPFSFSDREMNFAYSGQNSIRKPYLFFVLSL